MLLLCRRELRDISENTKQRTELVRTSPPINEKIQSAEFSRTFLCGGVHRNSKSLQSYLAAKSHIYYERERERECFWTQFSYANCAQRARVREKLSSAKLKNWSNPSTLPKKVFFTHWSTKISYEFKNSFIGIVFEMRNGCIRTASHCLQNTLHEDSILFYSIQMNSKSESQTQFQIMEIHMTIANCWELQTCQLFFLLFSLVRLVFALIILKI